MEVHLSQATALFSVSFQIICSLRMFECSSLDLYWRHIFSLCHKMTCHVLYVLIHVQCFHQGSLYSNTNPSETSSLFSIFPEEGVTLHLCMVFKKVIGLHKTNYKNTLDSGTIWNRSGKKSMWGGCRTCFRAARLWLRMTSTGRIVSGRRVSWR